MKLHVDMQMELQMESHMELHVETWEGNLFYREAKNIAFEPR